MKPTDEQLEDSVWRLSNLYKIKDENGIVVTFRPNKSQQRMLHVLWLRNLILKSRQQGFSTLIQLMMLDMCLFTPNTNAGIILQTMPDAIALFRNKIKFAYDNLPEELKERISLKTDSKTELILSNGSSLQVATSLRSGTYQFVHVSEMGKISRKFPERAIEIVTGTFPTVHKDGFLFVESTAEGQDGVFFQLVTDARGLKERGVKLSPLDFRFHFFAWHEDDRNRLDPEGVEISAEMRKYFARLELDHGIQTDAAQQAWYVKTKSVLDTAGKEDAMKREHPSFPDEAFEAAIEGAIYGKQMQWIRANGHITKVALLPEPVNTFWDLGHSQNNNTAIWFHQAAPMGEHRFIDYEDGFNEDLAYYMKKVRDRGYIMGKWYLPHDGDYVNVVGKSPKERLIELGVPAGDIIIIPRTPTLYGAIEQTRAMLPRAYFDAEKCAKGIKHLENYQWKWNVAAGCWSQDPLHNEASNGADALRQWAQACVSHISQVSGGQKTRKLVRRGSGMAR